jgi:hypothetical protein
MRSTLAPRGLPFACARCAGEVLSPLAWGPGESVLCEGCARRPENLAHARAYLAERLGYRRLATSGSSSSSSGARRARRCHKCGAHAADDDTAAKFSLRWYCGDCWPAPLRVCGRCSLPVVPGESFALGPDRMPVHLRCRDLIAELRAANEGTEAPAVAAPTLPMGDGELAEITSHEDLERARRSIVAALSGAGGG